MNKNVHAEAMDRLHRRSLSAYDFTHVVTIVHRDRSSFVFMNALLEKYKNYLLVWTEHTGYHCFNKDDLISWHAAAN